MEPNLFGMQDEESTRAQTGGAQTLPQDDARLIAAYERAGRTLDALPYTREFEEIAGELAAAGDRRTPREIFHRLHNLRKAGKLPRLGRAEDTPVRLTPEDEALLVELVTTAAGSLGQRDRLPCTPAFEELAVSFNARTGRNVAPHDLWRLIAKLAK
jgi:hypothetical protein